MQQQGSTNSFLGIALAVYACRGTLKNPRHKSTWVTKFSLSSASFQFHGITDADLWFYIYCISKSLTIRLGEFVIALTSHTFSPCNYFANVSCSSKLIELQPWTE